MNTREFIGCNTIPVFIVSTLLLPKGQERFDLSTTNISTLNFYVSTHLLAGLVVLHGIQFSVVIGVHSKSHRRDSRCKLNLISCNVNFLVIQARHSSNSKPMNKFSTAITVTNQNMDVSSLND